MASHTLLIKLCKEIYDIVVDGGVDGLVGRGVGGWVKAMAAKEKELFIKLFMQKKTRSDGH